MSAQAIYLQVRRGTLVSRTVTLPDGRSYKRVFPAGTPDTAPGSGQNIDLNGDVAQ